ncbi:MAG: DNA-directed RNA polymerase subunit alpha [Dehalococcoidales bacterium]|nr:DNA-directed RNA polymerase subunit alpha [Dehalococcoidales bacterium]
MSRLVIPNIECVESRDNFGRFLVEPLEKGFGVTLGNSLRRVLLNYLPGAAVTTISVEGVQHEFSTIPHVKEDVTEFILNVKELRLIPVSGEPGKLVLEVASEGRVSAADIKPSTDFEVANPELYLATLDSPEARLYVEFGVELGSGYRQAESREDLPIGTIPIDAIFTPIRKVNFTVEAAHGGEGANRERLFLDVWTDGSVEPVEALSRSASILTEQLAPFVSCALAVEAKVEEQRVRLSIPEELYNMPVDRLDLSVRTMNCLRRGGIETVGQIISKGEKGLMALRNFGEKSSQEIEERLKELGLSLTPPPEEEAGEPSEEGQVDET